MPVKMLHLSGKSPVRDTSLLHPSIEDSDEEDLHWSEQEHTKGEIQSSSLDLHQREEQPLQPASREERQAPEHVFICPHLEAEEQGDRV